MGAVIIFLIQIAVVLWVASLALEWLAGQGNESRVIRNLRRIKKQLDDDKNTD